MFIEKQNAEGAGTGGATHKLEIEVKPSAAPSIDQGLEFRNMTPEQFKERLERERAKGERDLLKELGIDSKKERKAALEEIKAGRLQLSKKEQEAAEAQKKADEASKAKDEHAMQIDSLRGTLKQYADDAFAQLPEPLQKYIAATSADDPQARLAAIKAAKESGLITAQQAKDANAQVKTEAKDAKADVKPPAPATTTGAPGPTPIAPTPTANHQEIYDAHMRAGRTIAASNLAAAFPSIKVGHPDTRK